MFTTYTKEDLDTAATPNNVVETPDDELAGKYQLEKCTSWIKINNYERTCLQFPESLLNDGVSVALYLQKAIGKTVYVLADTCYGSCCVDEVAAEHVNGDSIIHFGHACLSPVIKLPVLYIFEQRNLNIDKLRQSIQDLNEEIIIFYSEMYHHKYSELCSIFNELNNVYVSRLHLNQETLDPEEKVTCARIFKSKSSSVFAIYVGDDDVTLQNLVLGLPDFKWYRFTEDEILEEFKLNRNKFLMQKSHLVEKVKEANVVGILIGTLGIKSYLNAVERIKLLVKRKGKKCYMLAVGKPNVAKLANFPEIDVFVCIACQENSLLKDSKGYHKPIVSLFEVELALGNRPYSLGYTSDFRELLPGGLMHVENELKPEDKSVVEEGSKALTERHPGTIIESSGAQFLLNRSWQGLEQNLGKTEVVKAVQGRTGIPQVYENEVTTLSEEPNQLSRESA